MNVAQLISILSEYPPSRRLVVTVDQQRVLETTVFELILKLMPTQPRALVTFYGRNECVIREHGEAPLSDPARGPEFSRWLEIDMRGGDYEQTSSFDNPSHATDRDR